MALNPGAGDPIPPKGPVRVFISRALWAHMRPPPSQNPNQPISNAALASHSSPAVYTNSPAASASSPNASRKRKSEDTQESPRRGKFPPGTVGNRPVTPTPPIGSITMTPVIPPNGSPVRPASVTAVRPATGVSVVQVKTESQPVAVPHQPALNAGVQMPNMVQPGRENTLQNPSAAMNQPQAGTLNHPGPQAPFPGQVPTYNSAVQSNLQMSFAGQGTQQMPGGATGPTTAGNHPGQANPQIEAFLSLSLEQQRDRLIKLKNMLDEHSRSVAQLQVQNRLQEARDRLSSHDKIRDFIKVLVTAQQAKQNSMVATVGLGAGISIAPQNSMNMTAGQSQQPFQSNSNGGIHGGVNLNTNANPNNPFTSQLIPPNVSQNPPVQLNQFLWRGSLSITGQDGLRATPELLVYLSTIKAVPHQQEALAAWPTKIFMTPIRQHTPPDKLVNWLGSNKPEGLFSVRAIGLEHWASAQHTPDTTLTITNGIRHFDMAQKAIVTNKLVLHGTVNLKTGGQVTILLIHTPTVNNTTGASDPQIAVARYTIPPNLNTLPGNPMPNTGNVSNAPPPGAWGHSSATLASQSGNMSGGSMNTHGGFNGGGNTLGGSALGVNNDQSSNLGPTNNMTGTSLGNGMGPSNPTGGNNQQLLLNFLTSPGGANLVNSVGGANNLDISALAKNPQFMAQLERYKQQHMLQRQQQAQQQMNPAMSGGGGMGNPGIGNGGMNAGNLANVGLSGASLLDRLSTQPLGRNTMPGGGAAGNNAFGPAASSMLARQQFLHTLSAHSSAVGALAANNNNNPAAATNAAMLNQFNSLGYGLGGGINMSGSSTGAHNPHLNISVGNGMPGGGTMLGNNGVITSELQRRASLLANQRGISQQDALKALVNFTMGMQGQQNWNGAPPGGGG